MVKEALLEDLNSGSIDPIKFILYFIWYKTGKIVQVNVDVLDAMKYSDVIEWCRAKLFDEMNITILYNKENHVIKYY